MIYHSKEEIEKVIKESEDMITALECVGAMYAIPSSSIIQDDRLNHIEVKDDTIFAPNKGNPSENAQAIVCSIGAVLDKVSQRVDDKIDELQAKAIADNKLQDRIITISNPSKGKVIDHYFDDDGNDIIIYDTGLIDSANTPAAHRKIDELRNSMKIPMYKPDQMKRPTSYFSDEDDVMKDVDLDVDKMDPKEVTISEQIEESADILDMIVAYGDTRTLGYDIMQEAGFDYVKPTGNYYQEAAKGGKKKKINPKDIKHMKFDNKQIINAVNFFNKARDEQDLKKLGELDLDVFINSENYKKAIESLEKQFDAHINVRFIDTDADQNVFTIKNFYPGEMKQNVTVSKSKGFQLNGLPVDIYVMKHTLESLSPDDFFGQTVCGVFLHEMFHNIYYVLTRDELNQYAALSVAMSTAAAAPNAQARRVIFTKYVNSLDNFYGTKLNVIKKRVLVTQLCRISAAQSKEEAEKLGSEGEASANEDLDKRINVYKKVVKREKAARRPFIVGPLVIAAAGFIADFFFNIPGALVSASTVALYSLAVGNLMRLSIVGMDKAFASGAHREEHYCDMFAAMYQVPIRWFNIPMGKHKDTPADVDSDKLKDLNDLEKAINKYCYIPYPTSIERSEAGVQAAKTMLESKSVLDPDIKDYLKWIVDNYSDLLDDKMELKHTDNVFDSKSAEDLDKYLSTLIKDEDIKITESAEVTFDIPTTCTFTQEECMEQTSNRLAMLKRRDVVYEYDLAVKEYDDALTLYAEYEKLQQAIQEYGYEAVMEQIQLYQEAEASSNEESTAEKILLAPIRLVAALIKAIRVAIQGDIEKPINNSAKSLDENIDDADKKELGVLAKTGIGIGALAAATIGAVGGAKLIKNTKARKDYKDLLLDSNSTHKQMAAGYMNAHIFENYSPSVAVVSYDANGVCCLYLSYDYAFYSKTISDIESNIKKINAAIQNPSDMKKFKATDFEISDNVFDGHHANVKSSDTRDIHQKNVRSNTGVKDTRVNLYKITTKSNANAKSAIEASGSFLNQFKKILDTAASALDEYKTNCESFAKKTKENSDVYTVEKVKQIQSIMKSYTAIIHEATSIYLNTQKDVNSQQDVLNKIHDYYTKHDKMKNV